jgi:hypothetical protein
MIKLQSEKAAFFSCNALNWSSYYNEIPERVCEIQLSSSDSVT